MFALALPNYRILHQLGFSWFLQETERRSQDYLSNGCFPAKK
ncbi:hypothetical protein Dfer_1404 [Dyadobacter fermentans DSM 18053]|uniref:Uncharacterized protein n=1 Tax=Dyadobacter fermentans (strain ATCC 700827 / DSM 18053 / CIP 107007 / KCTC 52180 / NS114) TaxID=471854 RepID=C6W742_DYAFD|nr:hypothetical protein Dfer_1404 [Dyadobacter fermentans DSM 18053]